MIRKKPDPIEQAMETALRPARFIKYDDAFDFVQSLEDVKAAVVSVIKDDGMGRGRPRDQERTQPENRLHAGIRGDAVTRIPSETAVVP